MRVPPKQLTEDSTTPGSMNIPSRLESTVSSTSLYPLISAWFRKQPRPVVSSMMRISPFCIICSMWMKKTGVGYPLSFEYNSCEGFIEKSFTPTGIRCITDRNALIDSTIVSLLNMKTKYIVSSASKSPHMRALCAQATQSNTFDAIGRIASLIAFHAPSRPRTLSMSASP